MTDALFTETRTVPLEELQPYDKNPRKGDVQAIAESLKANGQFKPIVVQKSTSKILAGNHTYQAAQLLGWDTIAVVMVDVADDEAARIVLADNRTSDFAEYDNTVLAELLSGLDDVVGTGYNASDVDALMATMDDTLGDIAATSHVVREGALLGGDSLAELPNANHGDNGTDESDGEVDLEGILTLKEDMVWPGYGEWDIPLLRTDMMIEELPQPLTTWAGSATRDMEWDGYWLYNWGIDSTSGMDDLSKIMLSFYTWDEYFECWWNNPKKYLTKTINSQIEYAITPNYSQDAMPRALSLHALFRSRWIGRYLQEAGVRVMPDLEMRAEDDFMDIALGSLPTPLTWASIQVQNIVSRTRTNAHDEDEARKSWVEMLRKQVARAEIQNLLVYCRTSRWDEVRQWLHGVDVHLEFLPTRMELLGASWEASRRNPNLL